VDLEARVALLERLVARLTRQNGAIAFARSTMAPVDTGAVQTSQGRFDALTVRDAMPVLQHYGYASVMPADGDKVVAHLGGQRSAAVVITTGHQTYRYKGQAVGEVTIYDMWGRSIRLTANGIVLNAHGQPVVLNGDLHATGAIIAGYGGADQVGLQSHDHGNTGTLATGTHAPRAGS
jgi:phage gp45-like